MKTNMNVKPNVLKKVFAHNRTPGEIAFYVFCFLFFVVYSLTVIFVLGWALMSSFKDYFDFNLGDKMALPTKWLFSNYVLAFKLVNIHGASLIDMFINSIWFSFGSVLLANFTALLVGYIFAKYKFKGKNILYIVNIFTMIVPIFSSGGATMKLVYALGINDSPLFLVKYISCLGMGFLIYSSLFNGVSNSYIEAASIDGAGNLSIFVRVIFPQVLPTFFALCTTGVIGAWNDYTTPLYYLDQMPTLAAGLYFFKEVMSHEAKEHLFFAVAMMCCAPVIILFVLSQRKIMTSVYAGGLKG